MIPKNHLWLGMILNDQLKFNYCELHPQKDRKPFFDKSGRKEVKSRKKLVTLQQKIMEVLVKPGQRESAEIL